MQPIVIRLKEFLDHKGIGVIAFANALGYKSPQKIYRLFNTEGASPSVQIVEDIKRAFPELNMNWLFGGEGEMESAATYKVEDTQTRRELSMMLLQGILSNPASCDMSAMDAALCAIQHADELIEQLKP